MAANTSGAETSLRRAEWIYERFRPTLPTNGVQKRFVANNVSGNMQNVRVELKVEVTNTGPFAHGKAMLGAPTFL